MLRPVLLLLLFMPLLSAAQKPDRRIIKALQADVSFLASDALQGRMTGSEGERKAADYLVARYENLKIPVFRHPFRFVRGIEMNDSRITLGGQSNLLGGDAFPLPFSGNGSVSGEVLIEVQEQGAIWILPLYEHAADAGNPAFDWQQSAWKQAKQAVRDGATGVVFYDNQAGPRAKRFDPLCTLKTLKIPVAYVGHRQWQDLSANNANMVSVSLDVHLSTPERTASNVIAWIDNKAPKTILIGANYDGPGIPESVEGMPHPTYGADDNASGTAAVLQLAEWLKKSRLRNYNYAFAHFSGGRIGQLGAKAFYEAGGEPRLGGNIAGMIDLYCLGRMPDTAAAIMYDAQAFPAQASIQPLLRKAGFQIAPFGARAGSSEYQVFQGQSVPTLALSAATAPQSLPYNDDAAQINYSAEARIVTALQAILKQIDAAGKH